MIEIELAIHIREFYQEALPWLKGQGSKYTLFSGRNIVAFESDEDATAFMLMFGGKRAHFVEEMQERFTEEAKRQRFERSRKR
jgi:hypothetical protein